MSYSDAFSVKSTLNVNGKAYSYFSLPELEKKGIGPVSKLPFSIKVLLEAALRQMDGVAITEDHVKLIANWPETKAQKKEIPFQPARIVLQDFTGVPAVVDLAAMRSKVAKDGGDPKQINPLVPVDLVIDHSVMVDRFGSKDALDYNMKVEFERNRERYRFLRWAQTAFDNFRIVPPATGIIHQVNLEYLASVAATKNVDGEEYVFPDSLVGTDSHTTMINGIGVVGWGVGGIEAEAGMLGQPLYFVTPEVIGFKLVGKLPQGATATDLALTVTEILRKKGVVGKFVEFYGEGLANISVADRATVANMAPEYGATMGFFPVDEQTLDYLRLTGRSEEQIQLVKAYYEAQGLFRTADSPEPVFSETLTLDLSTVEPSLAGPRRPQDRINLSDMKNSFVKTMTSPIEEGGFGLSEKELNETAVTVKHPDGSTSEMKNGAVVIAAITSCTNTSNPGVLMGAGLLAKKAVEKGLSTPGYVKTSLTPGSKVVTQYLIDAGLMEPLEALGFHVAGYGCATCIGNSGPLPDEVSQAIAEHDLTVCSVLSGNRNFEGRIHAQVKANYLASPPLVVAYAIAGTMNIDLQNDPLGYDKEGNPVYLKDIWPTSEELQEALQKVNSELFKKEYADVFSSNPLFNQIDAPQGDLYEFDPESTYIQEPPFFTNLEPEPGELADIKGAKALALLGDSVTTDHISPAGNIAPDSPAGKYLIARGVERKDFNSYGSRRGNHEVMMRGTFANIRIRNQMAPGTEGGYTTYLPTGEVMPIYDAAMKYQESNTPLVVLAGKEYGTGSSRDWAAKGTYLLGVKAVIAESFERIHRTNLVCMGVLPLQFEDGQSWKSLGLDGTETFDIIGLNEDLKPGQSITVRATKTDGSSKEFNVTVRLDSVVDIDYYKHGGILQKVLRQMVANA